MASSLLSDVENGYKSDWGERAALASPGLPMRLRAAERDLRARVAADAELAAEIGDPWTEIAAIDDVQRRLFYPYRLLEFEAGGYSELFDDGAHAGPLGRGTRASRRASGCPAIPTPISNRPPRSFSSRRRSSRRSRRSRWPSGCRRRASS